MFFEDQPYQFFVKPAIIVQKAADGHEVKRFLVPSHREEFVMDALRKIITSGKIRTESSRLQAHVSLYEIRQELLSQGVSYSCGAIREALDVCSETTYILQPEAGKSLKFRLIDTLALRTFDDWKEDGARSESVIVFGALIGRHFFEGKYRRYNYRIGMHLKNIFARWLYKKMLSYYGATAFEKYVLWASTILRESGISQKPEIYKTYKELEQAFEELAKAGIIMCEKVEVKKEGRKITDKKFQWQFMPSFIKDLKAANARMRHQIDAARKLSTRKDLIL